VTDGRTDGQTDRRTEVLHQYRASAHYNYTAKTHRNDQRHSTNSVRTFSSRNNNECKSVSTIFSRIGITLHRITRSSAIADSSRYDRISDNSRSANPNRKGKKVQVSGFI